MSGAEFFDPRHLVNFGRWEKPARDRRFNHQCVACPFLVRKSQMAKVGGIHLGNLHRWHVRREPQPDGSVVFVAGGMRILMKPREKTRDRLARWFDPQALGRPRFGQPDPFAGMSRRAALAARLGRTIVN